MGDKKSKAEKKRLKAQKKLAKTKAKYSVPKPVVVKQEIKQEKVKWYKNPDWVRAVASIVAIVLTILGYLYFR